jgi:hypothetical protein
MRPNTPDFEIFRARRMSLTLSHNILTHHLPFRIPFGDDPRQSGWDATSILGIDRSLLAHTYMDVRNNTRRKVISNPSVTRGMLSLRAATRRSNLGFVRS